MKAFSKYAALAVAGAALGALAVGAGAQPPDDNRQEAPPRRGERPPRPEGRRPPPPPLETALDADQDGEISAAEIENAASALKKLDKNGDAKLTPEEYRPPRPPMGQGEDGPRGDFGQRRRGGNRDGGDSPPPEGRPGAPRDCPPNDGDEGANAEGSRDRRGPPRDRELAGPDDRGSRRGPPRNRQGGGPREDRGRGGPPRDSRAFAERVLQFDDNGDQKVAQDELPEQLQRLLEQGDTNNDNALDRAELERLGERSSGRQGRRPPPPREADEGDDRPRRPSDD